MSQSWLCSFRRRLKLREKIAAGYLSVLSISMCGVLLGYWLSDYFEYKTIKTVDGISESLDLLNHLQVDLLRTQNYKYRLMSRSDSDSLKNSLDELKHHQEELRTTWLALQAQAKAPPTVYGVKNPASDPVQGFLVRNRNAFDTYFYNLERLLSDLEAQRLNSADSNVSILYLSESMSSIDMSGVDTLFEELRSLIQQTRAQANEASALIESTDLLSFYITSGFILASLGIAMLLIFRQSRAITSPLLALSQVARRVTDSQNFELQAPVLASDEVGDLAISMNKLISSVHDLLQQLESRNRDISKQKLSLEQALEALKAAQIQLIQSEKMSALGSLVAGVAHEINNPVSFIYGNIEHASQHIEDLFTLLSTYQSCYPEPPPAVRTCAEEIDLAFLSEDLHKVMQSMSIGAERINQIVLSLRTFSRMDESEYKTVDLHSGLDSTLLMLDHRLKANGSRSAIRVIKAYGDLPPVACYAGQINQVFMSILTNAIDALEEAKTRGGEIAIATSEQNSQVVIAIANNGPSIPAATQSKLFDPFFTTKAVGKGTGMGMAISYQIVVDKHGGQLLCESSIECGPKFTIRLPLVSASEARKRGLLEAVEEECISHQSTPNTPC